ncbi:cytochrome P450 714C2-like [Abrus precatorius]|uniref:Cytochrome P450 714C2-like n=1 Tax=Abrus precatorius TaxID=3816 RepID=A0A8B8JKK6_ABRPR|nr:cytochrome P450 714C2-like [Abrus precatorius]
MSSLAMQIHFDSQFFTSLVLLIGFTVSFMLYNTLVRKPERLRSKLRKQGINGPTPTLILGNIREITKNRQHTVAKTPVELDPHASHDCASILFPFFEKWRQKYGQVFMFSLGNTQILYLEQPDIVRDITTCTSLDLGKPEYQRKEKGPLLGHGVISSNGTIWANQRKIIAPELYMEKVKGMMSIISEPTISLLNMWSSRIDSEGGTADIKIDDGIRRFSGDVISKACFGSNYSEGKEIFSKLAALQEIMSKKNFSSGIPGMRYIPTKSNKESWALEKEVKNCILQVVKKRKETANENDLLQMILEGAENRDLSQEATERFIVDNCKNIYLAGYETTAVVATWCLMLLASNQEWQNRVRAEALEICEGKIPDYGMLHKMKQLSTVIHESLRLYPPVAVMSREAFKDMKFGNIHVPKGVNIWIMVLIAQTNPNVWGHDAYKFNPERFANGITGACKMPHLYMPFGIGPRVCLGRDLAMIELKMMLSRILSKFFFCLSPKYIHSPILRPLIEPEHGVHLLVKKL